jgi:peptidyl-prolyl cis-trans isomerase C
MMTSKFLSRALLISALALLPACKPGEFFGSKEHADCGCGHAHDEQLKLEGVNPAILKETVVSFEGKPVVTGEDYERNFQQILQAQPALKDMLPYIPEEQQDQMFGQMAESMALEKLMLRWVKDSKLDQDAEYRRNARRVHEAVDRDLALRAFENELLKEIVITDDEAKKFYDENKATDAALQRPPFALAQGGVKAQGVEFSNEKDAKEFAIRAKVGDFAKLVKDVKKTINDYGTVNQQSFIDNNVKSKILETTKFPSVEVVKGTDGKFRVVKISGKQEPKYAEFDKVKDQIKQVLTGKKFNDLYTKKMADLKEKYKVEINKDYVNLRKPAKPAAEETALQQTKAEAAAEGKEVAPAPAKEAAPQQPKAA